MKLLGHQVCILFELSGNSYSSEKIAREWWSRILRALPPPIARSLPARPNLRPGTSRLVVYPLPLAAGGVREQCGLLVVGVHGAGGDDVIFVLVHQRQLGIVTPCVRKSQGKTFEREGQRK